jgi:NACalpha-BTF3-like transcription factor
LHSLSFAFCHFIKNILVTAGAERWRAHFCESRINQDAAAQQATCHERYRNKITRRSTKREQTMSTTTTSDWNDAVAKVMAESGASKETAEEALHESGGNVDGAILLLLNETFKSPTKPPPPQMDSGPAFIDDVTSVAAFNRDENRIDDNDDDAVAKSRLKSMYAPPLSASATVTEKASDDITGKTSSRA